MKTNEAPEKIYIQSFNVSEEDAKFERKLYFDDVWTEEPESGQKNIEYTRTDAFVEKVEDYLNSQLYDWVSVTNPGQRSRPNVIPKEDFIDGFKNYLKYGKVQD